MNFPAEKNSTHELRTALFDIPKLPETRRLGFLRALSGKKSSTFPSRIGDPSVVSFCLIPTDPRPWRTRFRPIFHLFHLFKKKSGKPRHLVPAIASICEIENITKQTRKRTIRTNHCKSMIACEHKCERDAIQSELDASASELNANLSEQTRTRL